MSELLSRFVNLSPRQREFVLKKLREQGLSSEKDARLQAPPIVPVPRDGEGLPLSFAQQRLWFLNQLEPESAAYNVYGAMRLSGQLDVPVLEQAFNKIVRRHEALRTTFVMVDGQARQVIAPALRMPLPVVDLGALPELERGAEVQRLARAEAQRLFDLTTGPLVRCMLLRLAEKEHVLLLTMHHIVSDGWSIGIFFREMVTLRQAYRAGQPAPLPELPVQYADFAVWQREWLQGEVLEEQLSYWEEQLAGAPLVLELPTDRPRPPIQSYRGACRSMILPEALVEGLNALSRREETTLFMTLLTTFGVLLYRYTGQEDILIGTPIAGRNWSEIEGLIGFFVNTLVLRTDLSGDPSFRELLRRVREVTLGAYAHRDLPFKRLVKELKPERDMSRSPLFQVMFVLQNAPMEPLKAPGLTLSPLEMETRAAKFDLTLIMEEVKGELAATFECNTDLFDETTIERMLGHLRTLLEEMAAGPEKPVSAVSLLTEAERQKLLVEWNDTWTAYPRDACIHELFEIQVKKTPDAVAVVFEEQHLTYRELNRRANQLAHHLQGLGVGPEVLVGICTERSVEMVVGILGILKAGGAYVPLDPEYPQERLAFMLADAQTPALLTQQSLVERFPTHQAHVLCLDTGWDAIAQESTANLSSSTSADNLAYVMYTSGSTGRPKGSSIVHRNVVRLVKETNYGFDAR